MGNMIPHPRQNNQTIRSFEPQLPAGLNAVLESGESILEVKVPGPTSTALLREFVAHHSDQVMPSDEAIDTIVSGLALVLPRQKEDTSIAAVKLDTYCEALSDIPLADLQAARDHLVKTARWFPTISEIRQAAQRTLGKRQAKIARARLMIRRHEEEWREPEPVMTPTEFAALKAQLPVTIDASTDPAR